jgi:SMC interacting uncharacterized protein involved in chromosome segregation
MTPSAGGPRPSVEEFNAAVHKLEARGQKITRRAVREITGGTMAVVNRMCGEYEAAQAAAANAYELPGALASQIRLLIQAERQAAVQEVQRQLDNEREKGLELESQVELLEAQNDRLQQQYEAERAQRTAAEVLRDSEREAHQRTKKELEAKCEALEQQRRDEAKLEGELQAQLESQQIRERDHRQVLERQETLIKAVGELATHVARLTPSATDPTARNVAHRTSPSASVPPPLPKAPQRGSAPTSRPHLSQQEYERMVREDPSLDDGIVF